MQKGFKHMKYTFVAVSLITIFVILTYIFKNNIGIFNQNNHLGTLRLNKIDTLLSETERTALIQQIVKESLKELISNKSNFRNEKTSNGSNNMSGVKESGTLSPVVLQRMFHRSNDIDSNHTIRNSKHKLFEIQITLEERNLMYNLLETFDKVMKKNNISYFLYGGTLLGSFRHHDIIPWDDDLDVIVPVKYFQDMLKLLNSISNEYKVVRADKHDKFYHKNGKKSSVFHWLWPYVDISYYEENDTHIKDWVKTYGNWYSYPKEIVFPLHDRPLLNLSLPAPKDSFAFLIWTYKNGSSCVMNGYSHMVEGWGPEGSTNCSLLAEKFPFVEHLPDEKGVREILKYKELEIRNIVVNEPRYAVAETFTLDLKPGFSMPKSITPPD